MSDYRDFAINPATGKIELAEFLDNHFGPHHYGVRFNEVVYYVERVRRPTPEELWAAARAEGAKEAEERLRTASPSKDARELAEKIVDGWRKTLVPGLLPENAVAMREALTAAIAASQAGLVKEIERYKRLDEARAQQPDWEQLWAEKAEAADAAEAKLAAAEADMSDDYYGERLRTALPSEYAKDVAERIIAHAESIVGSQEWLRAWLYADIAAAMEATAEMERGEIGILLHAAEAEIVRLRAALKPFAALELWTDTYPDGPLAATSRDKHIEPEWIVAARAALKPEPVV